MKSKNQNKQTDIFKFIGLAFLPLLFLGGCATGAYYYKEQPLSGGYTDVKIQDDLFKVGYGEYAVSAEVADDFALLRSAEVALENGYSYFVILDQKSSTDQMSYTMPSVTTGSAYGTVSPATYSGTLTTNSITSGGQTYNYSKPSRMNFIKCFKDKPDLPTIVYDAAQVRDNLKRKHQIK